jgi:hypothetical protein
LPASSQGWIKFGLFYLFRITRAGWIWFWIESDKSYRSDQGLSSPAQMMQYEKTNKSNPEDHWQNTLYNKSKKKFKKGHIYLQIGIAIQ